MRLVDPDRGKTDDERLFRELEGERASDDGRHPGAAQGASRMHATLAACELRAANDDVAANDPFRHRGIEGAKERPCGFREIARLGRNDLVRAKKIGEHPGAAREHGQLVFLAAKILVSHEPSLAPLSPADKIPGVLFRRRACEKTAAMRSIGLTGGIGSGKSVVARMLAERGAEVIDADSVGHDIYRPGTAGWSRVVEAFGRDIVAPDGSIDRKKLGARVFADPNELRRLNSIVHPLIAGEVRDRIERARAEGRVDAVVVEAAVLLEARWNELVDEVWVVVATPELATSRIVRDRGLTAEEVRRRIGSQLADEERIAAADLVIRNTGTLEELRETVDKAWRKRVPASRM